MTTTVKSYSFFGPVDIDARLDKIRRSARFAKVPSRSELLRQFIEEGLARMESGLDDAAPSGSGRVVVNMTVNATSGQSPDEIAKRAAEAVSATIARA